MPKQRVTAVEQRVENKPAKEGENGAEQRVTTPLANNPTVPRVLQKKITGSPVVHATQHTRGLTDDSEGNKDLAGGCTGTHYPTIG